MADIPIWWTSKVTPTDISTVSNALRANRATSIRVNAGSIVNPTIYNRIQKAYESGKSFVGFTITKTNDPNNMFILTKGL